MGLIEIKMKILLASDNYWNDLILVASMILLQLILGIQQKIYLYLMSSIMERQLIIAIPFIY